MNAKHSADRHTAEAAVAEMQQLESLKEEDINQLHVALKNSTGNIFLPERNASAP